MQTHFSDKRPAEADVIAFIVSKDNFENYEFPMENAKGIRETAELARFKAGAGQSFLFITEEAGKQVRIILLGVGDGHDDHQHAGAKALAKVQACGAKHISFEGPDLSAVAAVEAAYGATLRNWRIDKYRTKLAETSKPTITDVTVVGAPAEAAKLWKEYAAVADGVFLTRELVSEPANIIYPESFVERCQHLTGL